MLPNKANAILIVPVYNAEKCLENCILSITNQTVLPAVVVLINDGSTDQSGTICEEIARKHDFVHVFHKENGGVSSARNFGLELNESVYHCKYVLFLDPDDSIDKKYVEIMTHYSDREKCDLTVCGYEKVVCNRNYILNIQDVQPEINLEESSMAQKVISLHKNTLLFMCWNKIFRSDIIDKHHIRFPNIQRLEDTNFVYQYLCHCSTICFIDRRLYKYSVFVDSNSTLSTKFLNEACKGQFLVFSEGKKVVQQLKKQNASDFEIKQFKERLASHLESGVFGEIANNIPDSHLGWAERDKYIKRILKKYRSTHAEVMLRKKRLDLATVILKSFYKRKLIFPVVLFTYVIHFFHLLKRFYYRYLCYGIKKSKWQA